MLISFIFDCVIIYFVFWIFQGRKSYVEAKQAIIVLGILLTLLMFVLAFFSANDEMPFNAANTFMHMAIEFSLWMAAMYAVSMVILNPPRKG